MGGVGWGGVGWGGGGGWGGKHAGQGSGRADACKLRERGLAGAAATKGQMAAPKLETFAHIKLSRDAARRTWQQLCLFTCPLYVFFTFRWR